MYYLSIAFLRDLSLKCSSSTFHRNSLHCSSRTLYRSTLHCSRSKPYHTILQDTHDGFIMILVMFMFQGGETPQAKGPESPVKPVLSSRKRTRDSQSSSSPRSARRLTSDSTSSMRCSTRSSTGKHQWTCQSILWRMYCWPARTSNWWEKIQQRSRLRQRRLENAREIDCLALRPCFPLPQSLPGRDRPATRRSSSLRSPSRMVGSWFLRMRSSSGRASLRTWMMRDRAGGFING